jgi:hypothetical protein
MSRLYVEIVAGEKFTAHVSLGRGINSRDQRCAAEGGCGPDLVLKACFRNIVMRDRVRRGMPRLYVEIVVRRWRLIPTEAILNKHLFVRPAVVG